MRAGDPLPGSPPARPRRPGRWCSPPRAAPRPRRAPPAAPAAPSCPPGGCRRSPPGTLTVGTDQPVYPPWYLDDDPTSGQGFESAVAYAVAEDLGYPKDKVTWVRVPFNAAIQPGPKTYDINLTEFSITEERRQAVDFSTPYYDVKQAVVTLGTSPAADATTLAAAEERRARRAGRHHQLPGDRRPDRAGHAGPAVFNSNDDAKLALTQRPGGRDRRRPADGLLHHLGRAGQTARSSASCRWPAARPSSSASCWTRAAPLTACVSQAVDRLRAARHPDRAGDAVAGRRRVGARAEVSVPR